MKPDKYSAMQLGKGHGGNTPNLPVIREVLPENMADNQRLVLAMLQPGTRMYRMGKCKIFVSPPYGDNGWHLTISTDERYPTWDEVAKAWYDLVPEAATRTGAMILPPKADYINIHNFCLQVHELPPENKGER